MANGYYDRKATIVDGRAAFANASDKANEQEVKAAIESAWGVELKRYGGHFSQIDYYALRDEDLAGHVEMKARTHDSSKYSTVFLNFRKWFGLTLARVCTERPSIYVVKFTNEIRWIDVSEVDARKIRLGGCSRIVKAKSDVEPVIEIPIAEMHVLQPRK